MIAIRSWIRPLCAGTSLLLLGGLTAIPLPASPKPKQQEQAVKETPEDVAAGTKLFETSCSTCHGLDGGGGMGPNIQGIPMRLGAETVTNFIKNGVPASGMPAFAGQLNATQIQQIIEYLLTLKAKDAGVVTGNADKGKEVYGSSGCATCHMINGEGGDTGPELTNVGGSRGVTYLHNTVLYPGSDLPQQPVRLETGGLLEYMYVHVITKDGHSFDGTRVTEDSFKIVIEDAKGDFHTFLKQDLRTLDKEPGKSLMPSYKGKLSDDQLNDLVAYLASLKGAQ
jgi:putative heme-binding domain-containing protein